MRKTGSKLKVLQINKTDTGGGAAIAANRLNHALRRNGVDSKLLVQDKHSNDDSVYSVGKGFCYKQKALGRFLRERLMFLPYERNSSVRFTFSPANAGIDISNHPLVTEADVIHIHWVNQGFLSIQSLGKLLAAGKPIVWTQHDMWSFTGGCHYSGTCLRFTESCSHCPVLRKPGKNDLSARLFAQKKKVYTGYPVSIIACSSWLRQLAGKSKLLEGKMFYDIPNPIDTSFYQPRDKREARKRLGLPLDKKLLLFGAANVDDSRKGIHYFIDALNKLREHRSGIKEGIELVVFGKMNKETVDLFPFKTHSLKFITDPDKLVDLYNAADVFVLPSLQDNLPNTVMESLACGTPVVGFRTGGVPEMIAHRESGYLAEFKNAQSLSTGIYETLFVSDTEELGVNARQKAVEKYSEKVVTAQYLDVYHSLLNQ